MLVYLQFDNNTTKIKCLKSVWLHSFVFKLSKARHDNFWELYRAYMTMGQVLNVLDNGTRPEVHVPGSPTSNFHVETKPERSRDNLGRGVLPLKSYVDVPAGLK